MVIDTSALVAILLNEPERQALNRVIADAETCWISAASFVETSIVIEARRGAGSVRLLDLLLSKANAEVRAVDLEQAHVARRAFSLYGKGRHEAALNFGDCFSYALAKTSASALLFKGHDFARTDVAVMTY